MTEENSTVTEEFQETIEEKVEEKVDEKEEEPLEKPIPPPKVKKPRTEKQKEAFRKARLALDEKRKKERERKAASKKPRGRPQKKPVTEAGEEPVPQPNKINRRIKKSQVIIDASESSEEEIIYVKNKKK